MSSISSFQKMDNNRFATKLAMNRNRNRIEELYDKSSLLYDISRELRSRRVSRKEYDGNFMRLCGFLFNKCNATHCWTNKLRQKILKRGVRKLQEKRSDLKVEDNRCFMEECRALRRAA